MKLFIRLSIIILFLMLFAHSFSAQAAAPAQQLPSDISLSPQPAGEPEEKNTVLPSPVRLSWQDCVMEAAKNHPDLISAQASVRQSEAAEQVVSSGMLPQVSASMSAETSNTKDTYSYGVSGSQLLFDGFKTADNRKSAREDTKAAGYNFVYTSSQVRLRLRGAFIDLLKAQEVLGLAADIYNIRRNNLELITLRYESGIEHKGALMTAEANLAQAEFDIVQNKRALELARRELLKEMGSEKYLPIEVRGDFKVADKSLEKPDFEALLLNNPSLGQLIAHGNAAAFSVKAAEAGFLPKLSLQAQADKSGALWPPKTEQWNAGINLSLPLFEGGLKTAELARARALLDQARADQRSGKDAIIVALEKYWAAVNDAVETVGVQEKFLRAAEERYKIAEAQYSLGLIQFDSWTIIEDSLVREKKSYLDAQANALFAEAAWAQAKGETLEYADK